MNKMKLGNKRLWEPFIIIILAAIDAAAGAAAAMTDDFASINISELQAAVDRTAKI